MEETSLKDYALIFWEKKIEIMLLIIMFTLIGVLYTMFFITPEYKASTTLILARIENMENNTESITQTELTLNQKLITTYRELITSKPVLEQVINNLKISDISTGELKKDITVNAVSNTELIEITVVNKNNTYVDIIANEIAKVFTEKVSEIYNIKNVHVVSSAESTNTPYNTNNYKYVLMAFIVGAFISALYVIAMDSFNNTVKNSEQIENKLGLQVLATIPRFDLEKGGNKLNEKNIDNK